MNITKTTARQFGKILEKQGKVITDVSTNTEYKVIFSKSGANNMQDKIKINYPENYPFGKGTIVEYKNNYYLLINQDNISSDVYCTSVAIKCNCKWNIKGKDYYLVAGELSSPNPKNGTHISTVSGNICLYTKDTGTPFIAIDESVFDFNGTYTCINVFTIDGLTYYYFERELNTVTGWELTWNDPTTIFNLEEVTSADCSCKLTSGDISSPSTQYNYSVSDESIATIDENGIVTFLTEGSVRVTCSARGGVYNSVYTISKDIQIISPTSKYANITGESNGTDVDASMPLYYKGYTLTSHYYDNNAEDNNMIPVSWKLVDFRGDEIVLGNDGRISHSVDIGGGQVISGNATYSISGNTFTFTPSNVKADNEVWYYSEPTYTVTYADGITATKKMTLNWS